MSTGPTVRYSRSIPTRAGGQRLRGVTLDEARVELAELARAYINASSAIQDLLTTGHGEFTISLSMRNWEWGHPKVYAEPRWPEPDASEDPAA